jgi:putative FmdB family regulatory protein
VPLYDFHCRACGRDFEALVRPPAAPACPSCQSADLERQLSTFAVSSSERSRQAADAKRKKAAAIGARDRIALDRESEQHRKEDH